MAEDDGMFASEMLHNMSSTAQPENELEDGSANQGSHTPGVSPALEAVLGSSQRKHD